MTAFSPSILSCPWIWVKTSSSSLLTSAEKAVRGLSFEETRSKALEILHGTFTSANGGDFGVHTRTGLCVSPWIDEAFSGSNNTVGLTAEGLLATMTADRLGMTGLVSLFQTPGSESLELTSCAAPKIINALPAISTCIFSCVRREPMIHRLRLSR